MRGFSHSLTPSFMLDAVPTSQSAHQRLQRIHVSMILNSRLALCLVIRPLQKVSLPFAHSNMFYSNYTNNNQWDADFIEVQLVKTHIYTHSGL